MSKKDITLYDYQAKLLDDVEAELTFGGGDYFVDSCVSSGKSFMISALAERLQGNIVILISISSLLDQIVDHLKIVGVEYSILKATHNDHYIQNME
jgi:superfamily II DNA or RNA helicase